MGTAVWLTSNREPMAGGIAKAVKSPICPCIAPEPHAGGKCTKRIGTNVTPKDTAIPQQQWPDVRSSPNFIPSG